MSKKESPVSERIKFLLDNRAGGNKSELGRAAGISGQGIADLIGGKKGGPSFAVLQNILRSYPDLSERWLIFGEGPMLKTPAQNAGVLNNPPYMQAPAPRAGIAEPGLAASLSSELPTQEQIGYGDINISVHHDVKKQPVGTDLIKQVAQNTAAIARLFEMFKASASVDPDAPGSKAADPSDTGH